MSYFKKARIQIVEGDIRINKIKVGKENRMC